MGADSVQDGRSWMNDRIGKLVMSPQVTLFDDGTSLNGIPVPFDSEGTPRRQQSIVEAGVISGPVYDHYTAAKDGKQSTGHALGPYLPDFYSGPAAFNLFMQGGDSSLEEMIASTKQGLYITRFWYTRTVHTRDCVITGMTRDGAIYIEDGELKYPVKDLRFTQSYVDALARVEAMSGTTQLLWDGEGSPVARVPAVKIREFNFTGVTA
jgi:PmbA protein